MPLIVQLQNIYCARHIRDEYYAFIMHFRFSEHGE